ncbi:MFS transporter [uncultured Methanomethylovorans sp.]|uniref:MFS transporter n=1 Tax=uncultured Methanomethylovorans sp. TaxID=183759 RepID=UPI002AA689CC|nr:MFS transporter [uncultured Methanomethylovorans sp.]
MVESDYDNEKLDPKLYILSISKFFKDLGTGILAFLIPLYIVQTHSIFAPEIPDVVKAGIVTTVYGIFNAFSQPFLGRLSDRLNKRKPFVILGLAGFMAASLLYSRTHVFEHVVLLRAIQSITVGATVPAIMAMVTHFSTSRNRGRAIGIYSSMRGFGYGIGAMVGGIVATYYGYTAGFYLCALLGLISLLLVQFFVGETYDKYEKQTISNRDDDDLAQFYALALAMFMIMVGIMIIFAFLPEYEIRLQASELSLSVAVSAYVISRVILQTPMGVLSDRYGRKKLILYGLLLNIPIVLGLGYATTVEELIVLRAFQGLCMASVETPVMALAVDLAGGKSVSSRVSFITSAQAAGTAFGPLIGGFLGGYVSFTMPFYVCAAMMAFSLIVVMNKVSEPNSEDKMI